MALPQVRQGADEAGQLPPFQVPKPRGLNAGTDVGSEGYPLEKDEWPDGIEEFYAEA